MPNIKVECPVCRQELSKWSWGDRQKKQCNKCKRTVCAKCCTSRFLLPDVDPHKPKRVCDECATGGLKAQDIDADTLRLFTGVAKVESTRAVSAPPSLDPTAPTSLSVPPADRPPSVATEPPLSPPTLITQPPEHAQAVMPAGAPRRPTLQGPLLPQQHQVQGTSDVAVHSAAQVAKPQPEAPEQQQPSTQQGQRRLSEATASVASKRAEGSAPGVVQAAPMPTNLLAQVRARRTESSTTASPATATSTLPTPSHHPSAFTAAQVVEPGVAPASSSSVPPPPPPHASLMRPSPIATAGLFADIQKGKALRTTFTTSDGGSTSMAVEERRPETGSHAGATTGPGTGSSGASTPSQRMSSPTAGLLADLQRGKALKKAPKGGEEGKGAGGGVLESKAVSPTAALQQQREEGSKMAHSRRHSVDSSSTLPTSSHRPPGSTAAQVVEPNVAPASSSSAPPPPPPPHAPVTRPSPIAIAGLFADIQKGKALRTTPTTSDGGSTSIAAEERRPQSGSHAGVTTGPSTGSAGASTPSQRIGSPTAGLLADLQRGKALKKTPKGGEEGKGARGGVLETKAVSPTAALQQQQGEGPKTAHSRRPSVGSSSGGMSMMQEMQMRQERRRMSNSAVSAPPTTEIDAVTSASPPPVNDTAVASSSKPVCPPIIAARRQSGVGGDAVQQAVLRPYQLRRASVDKAAETDVAPGHRTAITRDSVAELITGVEGNAGAAADGAPPSLRSSQLRRASVEKGVDGDGTPEHRSVKSGSMGQLIRAADRTADPVGEAAQPPLRPSQIRRPSVEKGVDAEGAAGHRQVRTGSIVAELVKAAEGKAGSARRGSTEGAAPQARSSPPPPQGAPPSGSQQAALQAKLRAHTKRNSIAQPLDGPMKVPVSMSVGAVDNMEGRKWA